MIDNAPVEYIIPAVHFKKDEELERNFKASDCLEKFYQKGGTFYCATQEQRICFEEGDAVYPICAGGICRSQTLWALLKILGDKIILFPPHAARHGWDPYNGQINRFRNAHQELVPDEFTAFFGIEKAIRFGFENDERWKENLSEISEFYNEHYFGPQSSWQGKKGKRRIYIAFANNTHVIIHRLNQTNINLEDVTVVCIDSEDLITFPPTFLQISPRSKEAYAYFADFLLCRLNFSVD